MEAVVQQVCGPVNALKDKAKTELNSLWETMKLRKLLPDESRTVFKNMSPLTQYQDTNNL